GRYATKAERIFMAGSRYQQMTVHIVAIVIYPLDVSRETSDMPLYRCLFIARGKQYHSLVYSIEIAKDLEFSPRQIDALVTTTMTTSICCHKRNGELYPRNWR